MKKSALIIGIVLLATLGFFVFKTLKKTTPKPETDNTPVELPLNTLPLNERPYITLAPDSTGRSLNLTVAGAPTNSDMEYELIYQASGKQEGAIGTLYLKTEKQPLTKSILLGSKSGGGKITYHEGVTGGSLTVTYGETRLKESWNFLKFDPADPTISSTDGKFTVALTKTSLKKDQMLVTMKSFGLPAEALAKEGYPKIISGPYFYATQTPVKGSATVAIKLPAGEHVNPTIYGYDGKSLSAQAGWTKLSSKLNGDTVTAPATPTHTTFVVTAE